MSYHETLIADIAGKIEALESESRPLHASWVAHAVCGDHEGGLAKNEHADHWRYCGYQHVRDETRRHLNKRHGTEQTGEDRRQLTFPGFTHVQKYYPVQRNGEEIHVPTLYLTDEEIEAKAELYRKMGEACYAHADELIRFKGWRKAADTKAAE